jgi:hypothetical protein
MPLHLYTQEASKGPEGRFYVNRGAAGGISISDKNVTILACGVSFYPDSHFKNTEYEQKRKQEWIHYFRDIQ